MNKLFFDRQKSGLVEPYLKDSEFIIPYYVLILVCLKLSHSDKATSTGDAGLHYSIRKLTVGMSRCSLAKTIGYKALGTLDGTQEAGEYWI